MGEWRIGVREGRQPLLYAFTNQTTRAVAFESPGDAIGQRVLQRTQAWRVAGTTFNVWFNSRIDIRRLEISSIRRTKTNVDKKTGMKPKERDGTDLCNYI